MIGLINQSTYEVETRVYFNSTEEAFTSLPFLKDCVKNEVKWITKTLGLELFKADRLLRLSEVVVGGITKVYLGLKAPDIGKKYNIRLELDEDITEGVGHSEILELLGGSRTRISPVNINEILDSLGHKEFMAFNGHNLTGKHAELGVSLKLMYCDTLEYPLMLEIEKSASALEDAFRKELELQQIIERYDLVDRVIKKEPPSLLYDKLKKVVSKDSEL